MSHFQPLDASPVDIVALGLVNSGALLVCSADGVVVTYQGLKFASRGPDINVAFGEIFAADIAPAGDRICVGGDGGVAIWDLQAEREVIRAETDAVISTVTYAPDGNTIVLSLADETLWAYDAHSLTKRGFISAGERTSSVVFHPQLPEVFAATCSYQGGSQVCIGTLTPKLSWTDTGISLGPDHVSGAAFSPEGRWLAFADTQFHLYRYPDVERVCTWDAAGRRQERVSPPEVVERPWSNAVFLDDTWVACANPEGAVLVWNVHTGELQTTLEGEQRGVERLLAVPSGLVTVGADGSLGVWNFEMGPTGGADLLKALARRGLER